MKFLLLTLVVIIAGVVLCREQEINQNVNKLKSCYQNDNAAIDSCLKQLFVDLEPVLTNEAAEAKNLSVTLFPIKHIQFPQKPYTIKGNLSINHSVINTHRNYEIKNALLDSSKTKIVVDFLFPKANSNGNYILDGALLLIPGKGNNNYVSELRNLVSTVIFTVKRHENAMQLVGINVYASTEFFSLHLNGLYGGDDVGRAINAALELNNMLFFNDIKQPVSDEYAVHLIPIFTDIISKLPVEPFQVAEDDQE